jgi:16S rRNA (guanine527-N7)-methyltransferase
VPSGPGAPELTPAARESLGRVLELLAADRASLSSVTRPQDGWSVHVDDSLSGLEVPDLAAAGRICDVGSGAGFPGLALAAMLPDAWVDLVESVGRKAEFIARAAETAGIANATAVNARAEEWAAGEGREAYDAVSARAVGRLSTLAELASPLLRRGGVLVAWKGRRDEDEEAEMARAASQLAMEPEEIRWVGPYAGSRNRHLHVMRKAGDTPGDLPRRPGVAKKRPRGVT